MARKAAEEDRPYVDSHGKAVRNEVAGELAALRLRVDTQPIARNVWERLLSEAERARLGGDLDHFWTRYGTAGMWVQARGTSVERAIIEVALASNLVTDANAKWLLRELGIKEGRSEPADRPVWDLDKGELRWGKHVIRHVRVMKRPSNTQQILDAFQDAGWPNRVVNPLRLGAEQLHQTLRTLNSRLKKISFSAQEGGLAVTWKVR